MGHPPLIPRTNPRFFRGLHPTYHQTNKGSREPLQNATPPTPANCHGLAECNAYGCTESLACQQTDFSVQTVSHRITESTGSAGVLPTGPTNTTPSYSIGITPVTAPAHAASTSNATTNQRFTWNIMSSGESGRRGSNPLPESHSLVPHPVRLRPKQSKRPISSPIVTAFSAPL